MKASEFLDQLDDARVVEAIRQAETRTSGEIRVFVSRRALGRDDLMARAAARFEKLGMTRTAHRNAVLLYFMPRERKYAVVGDRGIHAKCTPAHWEEIVAHIGEHLRAQQFTEAVISGVERAGLLLAEYFPSHGPREDGLSDEVARD